MSENGKSHNFPQPELTAKATAQTREDSEGGVCGKKGNYVSASLAKVDSPRLVPSPLRRRIMTVFEETLTCCVKCVL